MTEEKGEYTTPQQILDYVTPSGNFLDVARNPPFAAEQDVDAFRVIDALRARVAELERERDWLSSIVENVEMTELVFAVDKAKALGAQEPPHA